MADYQEYRRRILHRRWRRMFTAVALLVLLVLLISFAAVIRLTKPVEYKR